MKHALVGIVILVSITGCKVVGHWSQSNIESNTVNQDASIELPADEILLSRYRPVPIHNVPVSLVTKASHPVIDVHSHPYAGTIADVEQWIRNKDASNIERTIILTNSVGERFDSLLQVYGKYPDRFEVWCGLKLENPESETFTEDIISELQRCHAVGGKGIGELSDKGWGLRSGTMTAYGVHPNDPRLSPVWRKAAELGMPVNLHIADPIWMYQPMDETNDGLMTAWRWRLDNRDDIVSHGGMMLILDETIRNNPETTFIVCHYANLSYDLDQLGEMFDKYQNLYADISARFAETAAIPRHTHQFILRYQDRLLYGTDMGYNIDMYQTTFRILQTEDEHFYNHAIFGYHWPLHGFGLPDKVLEKIYRTNAEKLFRQVRQPYE